MIKVNPQAKKALQSIGKDFDVGRCFSCGTCTALCPVGLDMLPRRIFRHAVLGDVEKIAEAQDSIYSCLLCRICESNCPQGVNISGNIRLLRSFLCKNVLSVPS